MKIKEGMYVRVLDHFIFIELYNENRRYKTKNEF